MRDAATSARTPAGPVSASSPFRLGDWTVRPDLNRIERNGESRTLEPRSMDVLVFLAQHAGNTCSREQILDGVWGTRCVVDGVVTKIVSELRRVLDDDAQAPRYLHTVSRRGYRLIADTAALAAPPTAVPAAGAPARRRTGLLVLAAMAALLAVAATALLLRPPAASEAADVEAGIDAVGIRDFDTFTGDAHAWLAQGISEQLAVALAQAGHVRVFGPAAMRGRPDAGEDSRVDAVLAGSLWQHEERLRLNVHLTDLRSGRMRWARQLDFVPDETFTVVAGLVHEVGQATGGHGAAGRAGIDERGSHNPEAYLAYLRARQLWRERGRDDLLRARDLFGRAISIDPRFALAHAGSADTWLALVNYRVVPRELGFAQAEAAARQALALDANLPEANRAAGSVRLNVHWDFAGARALFERAIALDPGDASAQQWLAECLSILGEHAAARAVIAQAVELEPGSPLMRAVAGMIAYADGRHDQALEYFDQADRLGPRFSWLHRYRADALVRLRRVDEAVAARRALAQAEGAAPAALAELDAAIESAQLAGYWQWQLARLQQQQQAGQAVEPALLAEALAANGDIDAALQLLDQVLAERGEYFLLIRRSPAFDSLAGRDDYQRLLTRAGLPVEH